MASNIQSETIATVCPTMNFIEPCCVICDMTGGRLPGARSTCLQFRKAKTASSRPSPSHSHTLTKIPTIPRVLQWNFRDPEEGRWLRKRARVTEREMKITSLELPTVWPLWPHWLFGRHSTLPKMADPLATAAGDAALGLMSSLIRAVHPTVSFHW